MESEFIPYNLALSDKERIEKVIKNLTKRLEEIK
jgi:hypothetical protein